jgi:hypothetical protein
MQVPARGSDTRRKGKRATGLRLPRPMIQEPEVEGSPSIFGGGHMRAFCIRTTEANGPIGYRKEGISPHD